MKRRELDNQTIAYGFFVKEFTDGFFGDHHEGREMLKKMGLDSSTLPFSAVTFLKKRYVFWKDSLNNVITISFKVTPTQIECCGTYHTEENDKPLTKKKSKKVFREWETYEDVDMIQRLESEAIGDLCMRCIYEIIN